jgi:hypothetical protein
MAFSTVDLVYPPEIWARESLLLLQASNVVANLVHRDFEDEVAQQGDVVHTRTPQMFTANPLTNNTQMTIQAPKAEDLTVALNKHQHIAFGITSRDQDTSIKNLVEEFMEPAVIPMAEKIDADLLNNTDGLGSGTTVVDTAVAKVSLADFAGVQKQFMVNKVPTAATGGVSRLNCVMSPDHYHEALQIGEVIQANTAGINPPAIRTGYINTIFGLNLYVDQNVPQATDGATPEVLTDQSIAFHRNALTFVSRPLEAVGGEFGVRSASVTKDGIGLRVMMSYQHTYSRWLVSVDLLYGYKVLNNNMIVRLSDAGN